jgi:6-phosphofructokinase 1
MVGVKNDEVVPVPLKEVAGKLKSVPLDNEVIASARSIGVSFGD